MNRRVVKISPDASLADAARLMLSLDIGSLLVMEGDELKGILAKSDFARLVTRKAESGTVKEIMSSPVKTTSRDTDLVVVANIMRVNSQVTQLIITNIPNRHQNSHRSGLGLFKSVKVGTVWAETSQ
jgi:CBS domain-containing protein